MSSLKEAFGDYKRVKSWESRAKAEEANPNHPLRSITRSTGTRWYLSKRPEFSAEEKKVMRRQAKLARQLEDMKGSKSSSKKSDQAAEPKKRERTGRDRMDGGPETLSKKELELINKFRRMSTKTQNVADDADGDGDGDDDDSGADDGYEKKHSRN